MTYNKTRHVIFFNLSFCISIFCINILLTTANTVLAAGSVFEYPRDANYVVIEYSQSSDMILDADPIPLLRIFGDGRVLVHYPLYMKLAGDYEMRLSDAQLQQLLVSLETNGILSFNRSKILELKKQATSKLLAINKKQILTTRSDATRSNFIIKLTSYQSTATGFLQASYSKSVNWKNLGLDSKTHPDIVALKNAAMAEQELVQFTTHQNLVKIK